MSINDHEDNLSQKNAAMQKNVLHCCAAASIHSWIIFFTRDICDGEYNRYE